MALTPEDVVNKRFQATKFREGYDQDEVDDFLDEVVVELRRLNQENDELRQRLASAEARANDVQSAPAPAPVFAEPAAPPQPVAVPAQQQVSEFDEQQSTTNLLQLARDGVALIDWGDSGWGDAAIDFRNLPPERTDDVLAGYREVVATDDTFEERIEWDQLGAHARRLVLGS